MKNILRSIIVVCLTVLFALPVFAASPGGYSGPGKAQPAGQGGYAGPGPSVISALEAKAMRDDAHVTMRGKIERHLGKDKYLFRDASGTITIEIDHDKWQGLTVSATDMVEVQGEVDKDWNSVEVEVKRITKFTQ